MDMLFTYELTEYNFLDAAGAQDEKFIMGAPSIFCNHGREHLKELELLRLK